MKTYVVKDFNCNYEEGSYVDSLTVYADGTTAASHNMQKYAMRLMDKDVARALAASLNRDYETRDYRAVRLHPKGSL